jgi:inhibitor of KinA sporulation pathway (predicted exonuclease)
MPGFAILRTKKLKTMGQVSGSAEHSFRELETPNANRIRTRLNEYGGVQSAHELVASVKALLPEKRRKDAVLVIEYLITASPEWFTGGPPSAGDAYFRESVQWLARQHGAANVIGWVVHRDESTPHLVSYVVPLDPRTGRLNARRWLGGRATLSRLQTEFAEAVARRHGLERGIEGSRATHQTVQQWYGQITRPDPVVKFRPQDIQPRNGETPAMLAGRLTEQTLTQLRPTFAAAKVSRSTALLAKKLASTARIQQHQYNQLVHMCGPVLDLCRVDAEAFETLMKELRDGLTKVQRKAAVGLQRARTESPAPTTTPRAGRLGGGVVSQNVSDTASHRMSQMVSRGGPHAVRQSRTDSHLASYMTNQSQNVPLSSFKHLLVVDLEATCWESGRGPREEMETIEFGAVVVRMEDLTVVDERSWFVRPRLHPQLSEFCVALTGINQDDVDSALTFEDLYKEISSWLAKYREGLGWASWGNYDRKQLESDAARIGRASPLADLDHVNLKALFAARQNIKGTRPALQRGLELCGLQFEGKPHRGIDDARNAARTLPWLVTKDLDHDAAPSP